MKILFVDDDPSVLDGLKRMLFSMKGKWDIEFMDDPKAAKDSIEEGRYDLVVSDLQMAEVNGVELLEHVQKVSPKSIRFILTGVIDHPLHGKALRTAHQVIGKPCRPEAIKELIQRAFQCKDTLSSSELVAVLPKLQSLPSLPESYQKVMDFLGSPAASPRGLGKLITGDIGMSAKIMQLANSAYYGRPGKIHNPVQSVIYLGMKTVEAMVLTDGIFSRLDDDVVENFSISELQAHCTRVGMLARKICSDLQLPPEMNEQASMAGILHDSGKIVMVSEFKETFVQALEMAEQRGICVHEAEKELLGFSHSELGAILLQLWTLPGDIIESTTFHHTPWLLHSEEEEAKTLQLPDVVYLADAIDGEYMDHKDEDDQVGVCEKFLERFGLTEQYQTWLSDHVSAQRQEAAHVG
jgi:HD-like signal output (HDOD) protein